jgi:methionine-gamma-lyase
MKKGRKSRIETVCIHGGGEPDPLYKAVMPPIYQTSTFAFTSTEEGARRFEGKEKGFIYTRLGNPTINILERAIASLEEGSSALATSSGMAAVSTLFFSLLSKGDHIVASSALYGATRVLMEQELPKFGIESTFVDTGDKGLVENAWRKNTKLLYVETPTNPTLTISDIGWCAGFAHRNNALLAVDNTFLSPILQRPLNLGADVVLHSVTKFLNGHSDVVGGVLIASDSGISDRLARTLHLFGGTMDPHQAWLVLRGLKTLSMRVLYAQENARELAKLLKGHHNVERVIYPEFEEDEKIRAMISKQMLGPGSLISFELKGGFEAGRKLLDSLKLMTLAVSLGGVETLIQHPASMTHAGVKREDRLAAGITDGLVRLSVGCESKDDLMDELKEALDRLP